MDVFSRPADEFVNDPALEGLWAIKAVDHMKIHFNLIRSIDPAILKLTPKDDVIYTQFREQFPKLDVQKLSVDAIKSAEAKEEWRKFCNQFENQVEDYNYATLLRLDSQEDYNEGNTIVVPRIQFLAVEVARNREGFNSSIREKFKNFVDEEKQVKNDPKGDSQGNDSVVSSS